MPFFLTYFNRRLRTWLILIVSRWAYDFNQVASATVQSGQDLSARMNSTCPLMYSWYDTLYTGAAHGHAGIIYMRIQVCSSLLKSSMFSCFEGC